MRYYLIAGEASGDLHASRLMRSIKNIDKQAQFRFFGGDLMAIEGGQPVCHFKDIAYMGFLPVITHLRTILKARSLCKRDIMEWQPDAVVLIDYAGFNLDIAKFLKRNSRIPVFYYISPKLWAWKEGRIRNFKRDVKRLFCIMPFEKDFFEKKHGYPVDYVGNPTANEVAEFRASYKEDFAAFCSRNNLDHRPVIALLAGSRQQEIRDNLPMMIAATSHLSRQFQIVLAGAPSIADEQYSSHLSGTGVKLVKNQTYALLSHATAALVTSGTATLETCCFSVPQVVLYKTPPPAWLARWVWNHLFRVDYISLVNLVAGREVVPEMMADRFTVEQIRHELDKILPGSPARDAMLDSYAQVQELLGSDIAPENAARAIIESCAQQFHSSSPQTT